MLSFDPRKKGLFRIVKVKEHDGNKVVRVIMIVAGVVTTIAALLLYFLIGTGSPR
jgi:hypothetical protein